jgi:hypothetical protein
MTNGFRSLGTAPAVARQPQRPKEAPARPISPMHGAGLSHDRLGEKPALDPVFETGLETSRFAWWLPCTPVAIPGVKSVCLGRLPQGLFVGLQPVLLGIYGSVAGQAKELLYDESTVLPLTYIP